MVEKLSESPQHGQGAYIMEEAPHAWISSHTWGDESGEKYLEASCCKAEEVRTKVCTAV